MALKDGEKLVDEAKDLIKKLAGAAKNSSGFGTMNCAIYDTAWVSCVSREVSGYSQWLFPNSFRYLLDAQMPNGGWPSLGKDESDILNGLAGLYALSMHEQCPKQLVSAHWPGLVDRISAAKRMLESMLSCWNNSKEETVGFEVLAPSLLDLLKEGHGISFRFPERSRLFDLRERKLNMVCKGKLYESESSTLLHSIEALYGDDHFRFDRIAHHKVDGSIAGSPSATAACLMRVEQWDDEAERYLHRAMSLGPGMGNGSVPSAFPSSIFETTWVCFRGLELDFLERAPSRLPANTAR